MSGVSVSVKERDYILVDIGVDRDYVACGNYDIFGKRAVAVYADALGMLAPLAVARAAVTALVANDVAFAAHALANGKTGYACALAWFLCALVMIFTIIRNRVEQKYENE